MIGEALSSNHIDYLNSGWYDHLSLFSLFKSSYFQTIGPRFETKSEIRFYADYFDLVGMTGSQEATLAQEIGLKFCMMCIVDNMCNGIGEKLTYEVCWN